MDINNHIKKPKRIDEEIKDNLKEKLRNLRLGKGKKYFLMHIVDPQKQKQIDENEIIEEIKVVENNLVNIKNLIKEVKKIIGKIFDQDKYVASYLLLGKALSNLEVCILLLKLGYHEEFLELSRSGHESTDLVFLFLDSKNSHLLARWFEGEIIENNVARQHIENAFNKEKSLGGPIELARAKGDIYKVYSLATHSQYTSLIDSVDVFYEDLDFYKYAGFHRSKKLVSFLQSLYHNILIVLKDLFIKRMDQLNIDKVDKLLNETLPQPPVNELEKALKKYKKTNS